MEKLQEALKKAREERQNARPERPGTGSEKSPPPPGRDSEIWARLTPFQPDDSLLVRHHVMTNRMQAEATPFDILRTKILLIMRQNGWKRLAITSPDQGSGKTTISCNLAFGLSRQNEVRAMLFDFDMRRPGIARMIGYQPKHGIDALLTGKVAAEEQMVRVRDNLAISTLQKPVEDPTRILLSSQTPKVLDALQAEFDPDVMLFDLGPMLMTDDARSVLRNVDCALIVARAGQTRTTQLETCEREVAEYTNVVGMVLNSCRHMQAGEDYNYYQN